MITTEKAIKLAPCTQDRSRLPPLPAARRSWERRQPGPQQVLTWTGVYDITHDPARDRWYADASWTTPATPPPDMEALRRSPSIGVDLNADHLACWVLAADGNPIGPPIDIGLDLTGDTARRDGRLRQAITERPWAEAAAASGSVGPSRGSPPASFVTGWQGWQPHAASPSSLLTRPTPPSGAPSTGANHSTRPDPQTSSVRDPGPGQGAPRPRPRQTGPPHRDRTGRPGDPAPFGAAHQAILTIAQ
ncbi:hypothetical protein BH23ACT9_BH23ACT9_28780 [soil metagenome]